MIEWILTKIFYRTKTTFNGHYKPTYGVLKSGYTEGIYRCKKCDCAGHYYTISFPMCSTCGKEMDSYTAKWDKASKKWIFKGEEGSGNADN